MSINVDDSFAVLHDLSCEIGAFGVLNSYSQVLLFFCNSDRDPIYGELSFELQQLTERYKKRILGDSKC